MFVRRMSKDLEIPGKEGARVIFVHSHSAHKMYMWEKDALTHIGDFYDQSDSSVWYAETGAPNLY